MSRMAELFLYMFRVEMENSLEDIQDLAFSYEKRFKQDEITNYVYTENEAFLTQEKYGIQELLRELDRFPPEEYKSAEDIAAVIQGVVKERVAVYGDPGAVYRVVNRKIEKILGYIKIRSED